MDAKLRRLVELLQHELAVRELGQKITTETRERMTKAQREYFLREQLGRSAASWARRTRTASSAELRRRIEEAGLPEEARREADRELERLANVPPASPEHGIIRTYLDWMASLPWDKLTRRRDRRRRRRGRSWTRTTTIWRRSRTASWSTWRSRSCARIAQAARQDERSSREVGVDVEGEGEIGPSEPNVPRPRPTASRASRSSASSARRASARRASDSRSRARSGAKFVRISLGGVHDEAEIRGHRRTYIGALPGPDHPGDPTGRGARPGLHAGRDRQGRRGLAGRPVVGAAGGAGPGAEPHLPRQLPGRAVRPVAGAVHRDGQHLDTIPAPAARPDGGAPALRATPTTRRSRSRRSTWCRSSSPPTACSRRSCRSTDDALRRIIAGLHPRGGRAQPGTARSPRVCREGGARASPRGKTEPAQVTPENVVDYLGRPRFFDEVAERTERPGVATGLAWTPTGGDVLFVEATMMPSSEERLILTGMLGDVMRESAQAALSLHPLERRSARHRPDALRGARRSTCTSRPARCRRTGRRRG